MLSKNSALKTLALGSALVATIATTGCRVQQTEEGEMPDVDVSAEGGKMPEYDVDAADVEVKTEERTIKVPDVDVKPPAEDSDPPRQ
ncbi:MAG TPA: hypothetical protein VEL74_14775 [Thermoanaerobaculia bacterium]|nr:hypothetical protein [Thermoanaerobaculia bacterium]